MPYNKPESIQIIENTPQKLVLLFNHETDISSSLFLAIFFMIFAFIGFKLIYHSFKHKSGKNSWLGIILEKALIYLFFIPLFFLFSLYLFFLGISNITNSSYECQLEIKKKSIEVFYKNLRLKYESKSIIDIAKAKQFYIKKTYKTYSLYFLDNESKEIEVNILFGGSSKDDYLYICQEIEKFLKIRAKLIKDEIK